MTTRVNKCMRALAPKKTLLLLSFLLIFFFSFLFTTSGAEGKSVMWTEQKGTFSSEGRGENTFTDTIRYTAVIFNPIFQVTYVANVRNLDTNTLLQDGDIVPVGARIRFEPKAYEDTDTFWFRTGGTNDSPYGYFTTGAAPPSNGCAAADYIYSSETRNYGYFTGNNYNYTSFTVAPPQSVSVEQFGLANLSCDNSGKECVINSGGTIQSRVSFQDTIGKTYISYRHENGRTSCSFRTGGLDFPIPAQTIPFTFTAVDANPNNHPPETPVISGPTAGRTDKQYAFSVKASDPDGDDIRYGFDWNSDNVVDQWMPATGTVASGTAQSASHMWISDGIKTFQVLAQDSNNQNSPFASHSITLVTCAANYGDTCTSSPNTCGMTSTGAISCTGQCSAVTPSDSLCTICFPDCSQSYRVCTGQTFDDARGCGTNNCDGTRSCDYNWKEVAP